MLVSPAKGTKKGEERRRLKEEDEEVKEEVEVETRGTAAKRKLTRRGEPCRSGGGITGSLANWLHRRKTSLYLAHARKLIARLKNAPLNLEFHRIHPVYEWCAEQSHRKSPEWYSGLARRHLVQANSHDGERTLLPLLFIVFFFCSSGSCRPPSNETHLLFLSFYSSGSRKKCLQTRCNF